MQKDLINQTISPELGKILDTKLSQPSGPAFNSAVKPFLNKEIIKGTLS